MGCEDLFGQPLNAELASSMDYALSNIVPRWTQAVSSLQPMSNWRSDEEGECRAVFLALMLLVAGFSLVQAL